MNASSREGLGNPPSFWQFVKSALDTPSCLEMVELLGAPAFSTRSSPSMAAFPAAFFIACGRPNQERCPLPVLTVLLLLTGEHQEEGDGASNEGTGPLGVRNPGVFFCLMNSSQAQDFHPGFTRRTLRFLYGEECGDCSTTSLPMCRLTPPGPFESGPLGFHPSFPA